MAGWIFLSDADLDLILAASLSPDLTQRIIARKTNELSERDQIIADMAENDDELEVDGNTVISEGDDNGAFVMSWQWVNFRGTELDKDVEEEEGE